MVQTVVRMQAGMKRGSPQPHGTDPNNAIYCSSNAGVKYVPMNRFRYRQRNANEREGKQDERNK